MRIIFNFQTSAQMDQFVKRIYDSGAYVRRSGDFSNGFKNMYSVNGNNVVELEPSYIIDTNTIMMCAKLCGGILEKH
jgi:hypothetical protein